MVPMVHFPRAFQSRTIWATSMERLTPVEALVGAHFFEVTP
jgi:hypothetical protein